MFENISFIKADMPFTAGYDSQKNPCVMFRKSFLLDSTNDAKLSVCGLGYAHYYINGICVTSDKFIAPVSDYRKTLWYNVYDVSHLLNKGENVLAVICGNGWYNETFRTSWNHNLVSWRDNPKFILNLEVNGEVALTSDASWKCSADTPVIFNQLRSGEHFDSRKYKAAWNQPGFTDEYWENAILDNTPPTGVFRKFFGPAMRECAEYPAVSIIRTGGRRYVFDLGQNMQGYIRLKVCQKSGDLLTIRHGEQIDENGAIKLNYMTGHYPESEFMTDKFICNGEPFVWSPMFVYHGFRYVEIDGLDEPSFDTVTGIFVHQDVKSTSSFECSDPMLTKLYKIGQMATLSNLAYVPTDCPTREKLGWANDAQSSTEQMLTNYDTADFFRKWLIDIYDAMRDDGALPGIIPTSDWGYEWGNGPVSEGILFEVPYRIYLHTSDKEPLVNSLPYFKRHIEYLDTRVDGDGMINYGLNDWLAPHDSKVPVQLINTVILIKCLNIAIIAAQFAGNSELEKNFSDRKNTARKLYSQHFINADGTCKIDEQTAVAMTINSSLHDNLAPLASQLKRLVEEADFHHRCGMVGLQHIYYALDICGLSEYAYRIITACGFPSYYDMLAQGATTLWEDWGSIYSKNHHMYTQYMNWVLRSLGGIKNTPNTPVNGEIIVEPYFAEQLAYVKTHIESAFGCVATEWTRNDGKIDLVITVSDGAKVSYKGVSLKSGVNKFTV